MRLFWACSAVLVGLISVRFRWRKALSVTLTRAARFCAPWPVRTWFLSSLNVVSRTWWRRLYESTRGAVPALLLIVSPGRSSEPSVPVSRHWALHEFPEP